MAKREFTIKRLQPKAGEAKYIGQEPEWHLQPDSENRVSLLATAFRWYNYNYGKKEAKDMIIQYLEKHDRLKEARAFRGVPDSQIRVTPAWACRMSLLGLELTEHELSLVEHQIAEMLKIKQEAKVELDINEPQVVKPNIQDHLREKVSECAGELEGLFDDFIDKGARLTADYKPMSLLRSMNISPQMIGLITGIWQLRLQEFTEVLEANDPDLVEGYSHLTKVQLKTCVKFCELVINDCNSYVQVKKTERKPRAKKAVSPEKQASKFKYLKEFAELKLKSEAPAKLVGASEAWLYDTAKRKLIHVVADSHVGSFTVKGSAIIGFDALTTVQKTLRKPVEQLKAVLGGGKPAARKEFAAIKSTEVKYNGRGNENLIILKAW